MYLCLNADRHTGKFSIDPANLAPVLGRDHTVIEGHLDELCSRGVCHLKADVVEICDRFWPYHKRLVATQDDRQAAYVNSVRQAFLEPACVCSVFTPADEKLAADLHGRGVPLETLHRAIWLGCARKYIAMVNGQPPAAIASLGYFTALLEEVAQSPKPHRLVACSQKRPDLLQARGFGIVHPDGQSPASQSQCSGSSCMRIQCHVQAHLV